VLPSLIKDVAIFLHPNYVAAVRYGGLLRKKIVHQAVIELKSSHGESTIPEVIKALTSLLNQAAFKGCNTDVVLSGYFTKHRIAKWKEGFTDQDLNVILKHQFSELYGLNENIFEVIVSNQGYRKNQLAFTVDLALHNAIIHLVKQKRIKLISIQPYFTWMVNYWHRSLSENAWLLMKEDLYFHIAKIIENDWVVLKTFPIKDLEVSEIVKSFSRELLHQGTEDDFNVYVNVNSIQEKAFKSVLHPKQTLVLLNNEKLGEVAPSISFAAYKR